MAVVLRHKASSLVFVVCSCFSLAFLSDPALHLQTYTRRKAVSRRTCALMKSGQPYSLHAVLGQLVRSSCAITCVGLSCVTLTHTSFAADMHELTNADVLLAKYAFRDYDDKKLQLAEQEFTAAITRWEEIGRPRDEVVSLYKARGNARVDLKMFKAALSDYNAALDLMKVDGERSDGTASYPEYPDTYVQRGLTFEGLSQWSNAVADYNKAIALWGGGRGEGVNPYVLVFRANALSRQGNYLDAIQDYEIAADRFSSLHDKARASDCRANLALALYEVGERDKAVLLMKQIVRKVPGYADAHIALAAHYWGEGDYERADKEYLFACNNIDVGCKQYEDMEWVATVRRWPPSLTAKLQLFLTHVPPVSAASRL